MIKRVGDLWDMKSEGRETLLQFIRTEETLYIHTFRDKYSN